MSNVTNAGENNFEQSVIERSKSVPVVVDFWAPWCGPCLALGPVLEGLAEEADGRWELVKVNTDDSPALSRRFGIQGIPAVKAFSNGEEVAQFVGSQPRPGVERWLKSFLPDPSIDIVAGAQAAERLGDTDSARRLYQEVLTNDPNNEPAQQGLERIALAERAADVDEEALSARLEANAADLEAARALAEAKMAKGEPNFFEPIVGVIESSDNLPATKAAQASLLELIDLLPPDDERVAPARRSLASVLNR